MFLVKNGSKQNEDVNKEIYNNSSWVISDFLKKKKIYMQLKHKLIYEQ